MFLACGTSSSDILGFCVTDLTLNDKCYNNVKLKVLPNLVTDVILGLAFMKRHHAVEFVFDGNQDKLKISDVSPVDNRARADETFCNLTTIQTSPFTMLIVFKPVRGLQAHCCFIKEI